MAATVRRLLAVRSGSAAAAMHASALLAAEVAAVAAILRRGQRIMAMHSFLHHFACVMDSLGGLEDPSLARCVTRRQRRIACSVRGSVLTAHRLPPGRMSGAGWRLTCSARSEKANMQSLVVQNRCRRSPSCSKWSCSTLRSGRAAAAHLPREKPVACARSLRRKRM